jgi:hypothetical protein
VFVLALAFCSDLTFALRFSYRLGLHNAPSARF